MMKIWANSPFRGAITGAVLMVSGCSSYEVTVQGFDLNRLARSEPSRISGQAHDALAVYYNDLGVILEREGNLEEALRHYRLARQRDPGLTAAYLNAGNIWVKLNHLEQAISAYRAALAREPHHPRALNNLAWVYLLQGEKVDRAIDLLEQAIVTDPDHRYLYLDSLGWALFLMGRPEEALSTLESALEQTPPEELYLLGETHYHLGLIHRARGESARAVSHFQESLDCHPPEAREREIRKLLAGMEEESGSCQ